MTDKPIVIDLDDLTKEMVEEALPHIGKCYYSSPCIIGTLFPKGERQKLDRAQRGGVKTLPINVLVDMKRVSFKTPSQVEEAVRLQLAFDHDGREPFLELPRIKKLMSGAGA